MSDNNNRFNKTSQSEKKWQRKKNINNEKVISSSVSPSFLVFVQEIELEGPRKLSSQFMINIKDFFNGTLQNITSLHEEDNEDDFEEQNINNETMYQYYCSDSATFSDDLF
ncbi:3179_t:CDS:2 [Entrophospora sp. SA101]|nr:431_t:CDS:2 [Entrophospora sp. SA101]CAJ0745684.1 6511_t:CDS:2 [Entrophospora sp. SA101]CAJ0768772.1 3179_t:CDS:2 [Entrophospora sp. SA101]CAJ0826232.1 20195_t:CDS:2 [Entrophospora sp. SA101]CAJ0899369.1 6044_t:CDS:2 [Entrophospora sp. SA101]